MSGGKSSGVLFIVASNPGMVIYKTNHSNRNKGEQVKTSHTGTASNPFNGNDSDIIVEWTDNHRTATCEEFYETREDGSEVWVYIDRITDTKTICELGPDGKVQKTSWCAI